MSISPYFRHIDATNEQQLIDDLTVETIQQRGLDLWYIPRTESTGGFDYLFGEDPANVFDKAVEIEFWCENVSDGFEGADNIGRFGLEMPDIATFQVSKTRFIEEIQKLYPDIVRPREGDLIVWKADPSEPMAVFEITFADKENPFYQIGKSNVFRIETERFNYSHETMQSDVEEIDAEYVPNVEDYSDSTPIQTESDTFVNFDEDDPFSDGSY